MQQSGAHVRDKQPFTLEFPNFPHEKLPDLNGQIKLCMKGVIEYALMNHLGHLPDSYDITLVSLQSVSNERFFITYNGKSLGEYKIDIDSQPGTITFTPNE